MPGYVNVELIEGIIFAKYVGEMNVELIKEAQAKIERLLDESDTSKILYNTLDMSVPSMKLAIEMQSFDAKIKEKVQKSATVVPGATTAFMASISFVLSQNHKVFHNNLEGAINWLK
ncbi:MAG: STAS/SEC14 domain-containing protein [Candidatus Magnetoovum sp. WYHC-5]|nr:STAS/SEC14 domain-containing protein [Candidatus Magnetoovum sp. WYHC-5]